FRLMKQRAINGVEKPQSGPSGEQPRCPKEEKQMKRQTHETLPAFSVQALVVSLLALACPLFSRAATANNQSLTCPDMEEFLRLGKVVAKKSIPKGVTLPQRATLEYKGMTHDAAIQTIDISKALFQTSRGTELNFRDSWKYN